MGSYLVSVPPRKGSARELRRTRRRLMRRVFYVLIGLIVIPVMLLRGYGPYYLNISPGTASGGPVSIETDHAHYRLYESISMRVANRLRVPIYSVYFPNDNCDIELIAEQYDGQRWYPVVLGGSCPATPPMCCGPRSPQCVPIRHPNSIVRINPGTTYVASWHPGGYIGEGGPAQTGPARVVFVYSTDEATISKLAMLPGYVPSGMPNAPNLDMPNLQEVISATLQVEDDGYRPRTPVPCQ